MAIIRRQRRISNVGISAVGVATRIGGSTVPVNTAPEYIGGPTTITFIAGLGGTLQLASRYFDAQGDNLTYAAVGTLPTGISLDTDTGVVTIASSLAFGNYTVRFTATDSLTPPVQSDVLTIAVINSDFTIAQDYAFAWNPVFPDKGILWNNAQQDIRGGIISMNDGDHGYIHLDAGQVRYFNYAGSGPYSSRFADIPSYLQTGSQDASAELHKGMYLSNPSDGSSAVKDTTTGRYVADEDNYPFWYSPRVDKAFWIYGGGTGQNRSHGIFDMNPYYGSGQGGSWEEFKGAQWSHGNNSRNADDWPTGPYWGDVVQGRYDSAAGQNKNSPNGWCEALDRGVSIHWVEHAFVIERNPDPSPTAAPYRIERPLIRDFDYRINVEESTNNTYGGNTEAEEKTYTSGGGHHQFINAGVIIGEWLYFIRPATGGWSDDDTVYTPGERDSYPDLNIDGTIYPGKKTREFWKVRLVPPYNQYKKLAQYPEFEIVPVAGQGSQNGVWGPSLYKDEIGNRILSVHNHLWVYDIDEDRWRDMTPANWKRVLNSVGGVFKISDTERHIVYSPGSDLDRPGTTNPVTGGKYTESWSRLILQGGLKARGRWVRAQLDKVYPGRSGTDIPIGKHRRFKYFPNHRRKDGRLMQGTAPQPTNPNSGPYSDSTGGYVWVFGGDYEGIPYTQSTTVTNYPTAPGGWATDSGRQDQYRSHVAEVNGRQIMELACNHVAFYPYTGGTPDPNIQLGPAHPDGVGLVCDRDGWIWVGPGYFRFQHATTPPSAGSTDLAMYRFRLPDLAADGVRKGDGWERVPQGTWPMVKNQFGGSNMWSDYDPIAHNVVFATIASDPWKYFVFRFPCSPTDGVHTPVRSLATGATDTAARQRWEKFCNEQVVRSQKYDFTVQGGNTILCQGHPYQNGDEVAFVDGTTGPGLTQGHNFIVRNAVPGVSFQLSAWANVPLSQIGTLAIIDTLTAPTGACKVRRGVNPTSGGGWTGSQAVVGDYLYSCINSGSTAYSDVNVSFMVRFNLRNEAGNYNDYEFIAYHPDFFWTRPFDRPSLIDMGVDTVCELRDMQAMGHLLVIGPPAIECYDTDPWYWYYDTNRRTWTKGETYAQLKSGNSGLPTGYNHAYTNEAGQNIVFNGGTPHVARGLMGTVSETGEMWYWTLNQSGESGVVKVRIW